MSRNDTFVRDRLPPASQQPEFRFDLPDLHYPDLLNAAVALLDHDADTLAVINASGRWTFGDMRDLSDRIARLLVEEEGLVPGNRVLLRGPNTAMMLAAWAGILKAGGIVVATMPMLRPAEIVTILDRARISHAIVDAATIDDFLVAVDECATVRSTLIYAGDSGAGDMEARLRNLARGFAPVATHRDDPALIAFTSGTTGRPKGCVHDHRDILASADSFARHVLHPQAGDRWACSAPMAFTFGLGMGLIFPWRFGGATVTIDGPGPQALLAGIARFGVTTLGTAPTAYKAMLPLLADHHLATLRTCVSAGEHLPSATWHAWHDATNLGIVDGIGATEMMHIFISASGDDIRPGSTGRIVPGYTGAVLDEAGDAQAVGIGRLAIRGPTGCRYFDDPRQTDYVVGGWNVTGDTYRIDDDGYYWYVARSDDMIISSGYNIAAPDVEDALLSHPAVAECAVVGLPCPERGQRVTAFVIPAPGVERSSELVKALQSHVKATIAPYKYPRDIRLVDTLPRTATGKLQRFALKTAT